MPTQGVAMFDYVQNEYNPDPALVTSVEPAPAGRAARHVPFSVAPFVELPADLQGLRVRHGSRYWSTLGRKQRRLTDRFGPVNLRVRTEPAEITDVLGDVQALFAQRWRDEYTGLDWKSATGFAPYASAVTELAKQGRALVATLEAQDQVLAFAYCLCEPPWCYLYQFAATRDPSLRPFSPGKLLLRGLIETLTVDDRYRYLDLMLGAADHKSEWATGTRTVWLRLEERDTPLGRGRLLVRDCLARAALYVRFGSPRLRRAAKWAMLRQARVRARLGRAARA